MSEIAPQSSSDCIYQNQGNLELVRRIRCRTGRVLDVGCGAGDNARLLASVGTAIEVVGITASEPEAAIASNYMKSCLIADIEDGMPLGLGQAGFDCMLFSHVLEHLREPSRILASFLPQLKENGQVLIAVPNIANFRSRWQLMMGRFEYQAAGVFDETHLRFFTYHSVDHFLLRGISELRLVEKAVSGSVPLWHLRRYILAKKMSNYIDRVGCHIAPNLFGGQIIMDLEKNKPTGHRMKI